MSSRLACGAVLAAAVCLTACGSPVAGTAAPAADAPTSGLVTIVADTRRMGADRTGEHRFTGGPTDTCTIQATTGRVLVRIDAAQPDAVDSFRLEAPMDASGPASVEVTFESTAAGTSFDSDYADSKGNKGRATGSMTRNGARLDYTFEATSWDRVQFRGSGSCPLAG